MKILTQFFTAGLIALAATAVVSQTYSSQNPNWDTAYPNDRYPTNTAGTNGTAGTGRVSTVEAPIESARTLGTQSATAQSDSVRSVAAGPIITSGSETQTVACPAPQVGTMDQARTVTYTNGTPTSYGAWVTTTSNCAIVTTSSETQTNSCPAPQTGTITETRDVTTTNGVASYGAWTTVSNTCSLTSTTNETQTVACPAPQTGTMTQSRTVTTTSGVSSYGAWSTTASTCGTTTTSTETQTVACPAPQTGSLTQSRTVTTTNGVASYGAWANTASTCATVTTSTETQSVSCPAPQTGNISQSRIVTTTNGVASNGAWTNVSDTCVTPPVCSLVTKCEGVNNVTRNSCSNAITGTDLNSATCGYVSVTTVPENRKIACAAGYSGNIWQSRSVTYTNGVQTAAGAWAETSNDCAAITPPDPMVTLYRADIILPFNDCNGAVITSFSVLQSQIPNLSTGYTIPASGCSWDGCATQAVPHGYFYANDSATLTTAYPDRSSYGHCAGGL